MQLEDELETRGVVVAGTVTRKDKSSSTNSSPSFSVEVRYRFGERTFSNPYWIRRSRWESLHEGDSIEVTVLPDDPYFSQLTEYVGKSINGRGFIPLRGPEP